MAIAIEHPYGTVGFLRLGVQLRGRGSAYWFIAIVPISIYHSCADGAMDDKSVINKVQDVHKNTCTKASPILDLMSSLNGFMELDGKGQMIVGATLAHHRASY